MAMILDYDSDTAIRMASHFRRETFVIGKGPDFFEWVAAQGGKIINNGNGIHIEFEDDRLYTLFMLKY